MTLRPFRIPDSFWHGVLCASLLAWASLASVSCSGPKLYRIAQANAVSARSFVELVRLEQAWYRAGYVDATAHADWTRALTLWGESGKRLTAAIRAQNEAQSLAALVELSSLAEELLEASGLVDRLPENAQAGARAILHGLQAVLSSMTMILEVRHDPAALDPADAAIVWTAPEDRDRPGYLHVPVPSWAE